MKLRMPDKYSVAAVLLIVTAAILVWVAVTTHLGGQVATALILSGMVCAITGIFSFAFSGGEPVYPGLLSRFA